MREEVKTNLREFRAFLAQCESSEENLHRLLGIGVEDTVDYEIALLLLAEKKHAEEPKVTVDIEAQVQSLLFGAWFALYKRKKR